MLSFICRCLSLHSSLNGSVIRSGHRFEGLRQPMPEEGILIEVMAGQLVLAAGVDVALEVFVVR